MDSAEIPPISLDTTVSKDESEPTVLPSNVASIVTAVSLATRLSLRCSSIFLDALFDIAKYGTSLTLGELPYIFENDEDGLFNKALDTYTSFGLYLVNHTFSLSELFALSGLKFTSQTVKSTLKAAEESVRLVDGVFGANDTSRSIATFIGLLHREFIQDESFGLSKSSKPAILIGLTKALTAFAILQNVTQKSFPREYPTTIIWEGIVPKNKDTDSISDEAREFMRPRRKSEIENMTKKNEDQIIQELNAILSDPSFESSPSHSQSMQQLGTHNDMNADQEVSESIAEKRRNSHQHCTGDHPAHISAHKRTYSSPEIDMDEKINEIIANLSRHKATHSLPDISIVSDNHNCTTCQINAAISKTTNCIKNGDTEEQALHEQCHSSGIDMPSIIPAHGLLPEAAVTQQSDLQQRISYYEHGWNFPRNHIIYNIGHFMRYASAAYGESFMRILGIGEVPTELPETDEHHRNHHAFAHHTRNSVEDILLSSYTDTSPLHLHNPSIHTLVHYVTVDHASEAIVLTCRGTLGLSDVLTDISMEYEDFYLPNDPDHPPMKAHQGMLAAAQLLAKEKGKVYQMIRQGLETYPGYGLVMCGHSLGASVASLLCLLWSEKREIEKEVSIPHTYAEIDMPSFVTSPKSGLPAGRPIHCYAFGPAAVMSSEMSQYCAGLVTSVVNRHDVVSGLSLGTVKEFKNIATSIHAEGDVAEKIIKKAIKRLQKGKKAAALEDDEWFISMIKTMRADMKEEKMYPPGTVYLVECKNVDEDGDGMKEQHVVLRRCDDIEARFSEISFAKSMFIDHSPVSYESTIKKLCRGFYHVDYI